MGSRKMTDQGGRKAPYETKKGEPHEKKYSGKTPVAEKLVVRKMHSESNHS